MQSEQSAAVQVNTIKIKEELDIPWDSNSQMNRVLDSGKLKDMLVRYIAKEGFSAGHTAADVCKVLFTHRFRYHIVIIK